jgi:hypothetical protein
VIFYRKNLESISKNVTTDGKKLEENPGFYKEHCAIYEKNRDFWAIKVLNICTIVFRHFTLHLSEEYVVSCHYMIFSNYFYYGFVAAK